MSNVFDYTNNISQATSSIWDENSEKDYSQYMVNRGMSYHHDCIMFVQEMNRPYIPSKNHYDFLRLAINTKKKRFSKWFKPEKMDNIETLAKHYGFSIETTKQYVELLSDDDINEILRKLNPGGR